MPLLREAEIIQGLARSLPPPHPIGLDIDREKIRTVVRNLLENARKFSLPGSGQTEIELVDEGAPIRVHVRDDGPGIPESEIANVFEPFYRLDRSRSRKTGGYGLGLSICKRIMEAHGGSIAVTNNSRRGASFVLTFPNASHREDGASVDGKHPQSKQG